MSHRFAVRVADTLERLRRATAADVADEMGIPAKVSQVGTTLRSLVCKGWATREKHAMVSGSRVYVYAWVSRAAIVVEEGDREVLPSESDPIWLRAFHDVEAEPGSTASEVAKDLGERPDVVSMALLKLVNEGRLVRTLMRPGRGRPAWSYRVPA